MRPAILTLAAAALTLFACGRPAEPTPAPEPVTEAAEASGVAPASKTSRDEAPGR